MSSSRIGTLAIAIALGVSAGANAHTNEHGIDAQNFDATVGACTDFFAYANGDWLKSNPIPAAYSQWSLDDELRERNLTLLREILDKAAKDPGAVGSTSQKIGDFYASALDETAVDAAGYAPIKPDLARVDATGAGRGHDVARADMQHRTIGREPDRRHVVA